MSELEHAQLIPVTGNGDTPKLNEAITVQFNPSTLRVALSNTLKASKNEGSDRAAQFVDKSSSSLTVELQFDTSESLTDVRRQTGAIAEKFLKPRGEGEELAAPERCLFQWGAFEFVGMLASVNENIDFFAPEGIPLRASASLRIMEDRYQFRSAEHKAAERDTPSFGAASPQGQGATPVSQANDAGGADPRDWRRTAQLNDVEQPRFPEATQLAIPNPRQQLRSFTDRLSDAHPDAGDIRRGLVSPTDFTPTNLDFG